jgi:hypothetical protein
LHLIGDPQALEHLGEMDTARAAARWIDIGERLRGEQRAFQGVWRRDVGLGCALADDDDDAGAGEHRHGARRRLAVLHQGVDPLPERDDDIGGFAALDTFHGRAASGERERELVSGRALELRPEIF